MPQYTAPLRDMHFVLRELAGIDVSRRDTRSLRLFSHTCRVLTL